MKNENRIFDEIIDLKILVKAYLEIQDHKVFLSEFEIFYIVREAVGYVI